MAAMGGMGIIELLMVVLLGGGLNLPVGLPPAADDPKMSQVAPEQALFYMSWAGTAEADPKSANMTERLLAEPQVKFMMRKIEEGILGAVNQEARNHEEAKVLIKHAHLVIKQTLLRPTTLYVSKLEPFGERPVIEAGLVVNFGDQAAAVKKALDAFEAILVKELGADVTVMPANEGGLRRLPLPEDEGAPLVAWGFEGDYLIIAVGKESAGRLRGALTNGKMPAWLAEVRKRVAPPRLSSLTYVNTAVLLKQFGPMLASEMMGGPEARQQFDRVMTALGVDKMNHFVAVTGFDDAKFVTRSHVAAAPDAGGLFNLIPKAGLTAADLADVPRDADLAFTLKASPTAIYDQIMSIVGAIEPRARQEVEREMKQAEDELGFNFKTDLLDSVGDVFAIYNSPSDGGLVITGLTGVMHVKDHAKASKVIAQLEKLFDAEWNRGRRDNPDAWRLRRYEIKTLEVGTHQVRYINAVGDDWVVSPAWCLTKDRFIIAPYPQMVRSFLERKARNAPGSLADAAQVKELFAKGATPAAVTYIDTPELFKKGYPLVHGFATVLMAELQREGFDMDITALPTASSIQKHLTPDTAVMSRVADGIVSESHSSLPVTGVTSALPVVMTLFLAEARSVHHEPFTVPHAEAHDAVIPAQPAPPRPMIRSAAAMKTQSMGELRQIGIAIFVHHNEKNASAQSLADLKPYLGKEIKADPWGQSYLYFGKNLTPAGKDAAQTPFAATTHLIDGKRIVLYGDAHVELVDEKEFKKQMEAAKLAYPAPVELKRDDVKDDSKSDEKHDSKNDERSSSTPRSRTTNEKE